MFRVPRPLRPLLAGFLLLASLPAGYAGYLSLSGNVHTVQPGVLYRSGQLSSGELSDIVKREGIKTIINLRGSHPDVDWYRDETKVAVANGVTYIPIGISARSEPRMAVMMEIAKALQTAPRPILVHCKAGADRTGLAAAIFELAVRGQTESEAAAELSFRYGHFPWLGSRTIAMDKAFADFADTWEADASKVLAAGG